MTALLTDNLPLLAGAPNGIKKLRELILELAVRGKLVPQDPSDEPATELLKRIAEKKARLLAEGKIKKQNSLAEISDEEEPFELPAGWLWTRLGEICLTQTGTTPSKSQPELFGSDVPFIKPGDIYPNKVDYNGESLSSLGASQSGRIAQAGSLLMVCIGTIGKCNLIDRDCSFNQQINSATLYKGLPQYLKIAGRSPYFQAKTWSESSSTTIAILNKGKWEAIPLPLPGIAEQHRIVAKVDELMALCDRLEAQQADAESAHAQLVQALLDSLTQASDATDFAASWQRLAEHFHTLFTTEFSIDTLKQTLLQLAVMGKLAPQDPNDEPANKLLGRIVSDRQQLANEGRFKKQKNLTEITEEEKLFAIPKNWEWARISSFSELKSGLAYKSEAFSEVGKNQVIRMGNIRPGMLRLETNPAFISNDLARDTFDFSLVAGDIVLTMTGTKGKQDYMYSVLIEEKHLEKSPLFLNQRLCAIRAQYINQKFLTLILQDQRLLDPIFRSSTGTANQANIGMSALNNWALPIPPLAEQNRIVNAADQVMNICEAIKIKISTSYNVHNLISSALIVEGLA